MKSIIKLFVTVSFLLSALFAKDWVDIGSPNPSEPDWTINNNTDGNIEISFNLSGYFIEKDSNGDSQITFPGGVPILKSGAPELPRMARSIIIPDLAHMELSVIETKYFDIDIENILPSKGNLTRDIDPETVPYIYGKSYEADAWYPENFSFVGSHMRSLLYLSTIYQNSFSLISK